MRPLTEKETQTLFTKLAGYTGNSLKNLIAPLDNGPDADRYVFRLQKDRVYYVRLSIANLATSIARDKLLSLGTCLGKLQTWMHAPAPSQMLISFSQANLPRPESFAFTSLLSPSSPSMPATRCG